KVYPEIAYKRQKDFVREKLQEMEKRHMGSGDSVFLLEPHIKEGEGGLRDVHTAYWLSKVALKTAGPSEFFGLPNPSDRKRFLSAYDFLLRTRFCLHLESCRKNDILSFEYQRNVSQGLGFRDSKKFRAAERMLRYYYLKSKVIKDVTRSLMVTCSRSYVPVFRDFRIMKITDDFSVSGGRLIAVRENLLADRPEKIIESFYWLAKTGKKFSLVMKDNIRTNLLKINRRRRSSPEAVHYFLEIFRGPRVYETLREMHETGVLGRFVPEFGALRSLVVHEPYHMYTVDEHTLHAVRYLEELKTTRYRHLEGLQKILLGMERLDTLFMALLFHDIGKAAGRHHEEEGYKRLKHIMERFNLDIKKRMRIEFLVRNHILMSRTAMRSEASDAGVVAGFADAVGDPENLKAIYLITYADMSAVNPGFWTTWKAYLLRELYENTMAYLTGISENRTGYFKALTEFSPASLLRSVEEFVEEMPERYVLSTPADRVVNDYRLLREASKTGFAMRTDSSADGVAELSVSAGDRPGLFSKIVGLLLSRGLNIVNGKIFTGKKGVVIDRISVSNWKEVWWDGLETDLEQGLRSVITDERPVPVVRRSANIASPFDIFIEIDNEASEEFSVVEVFSPDRMGLLYDVTDVMFREGVNIVSARINTEAGLAQDVFYVQTEKEKIDYQKAQELLWQLWNVLKN
ncbi:MAG: HD domain-containing protein, partial [Nitrospirae bacterium]|nr:HD domain-containing protein [Nitrospirota bacterium]